MARHIYPRIGGVETIVMEIENLIVIITMDVDAIQRPMNVMMPAIHLKLVVVARVWLTQITKVNFVVVGTS
jgi:hypothetical protein